MEILALCVILFLSACAAIALIQLLKGTRALLNQKQTKGPDNGKNLH